MILRKRKIEKMSENNEEEKNEKSENKEKKRKIETTLPSFTPNLDYKIDTSWMAISKSRNASLKDYCLDYFEMYNIKDISDIPKKMTFTKRKAKEEDNFKQYLFSRGNKFEEDIVGKIKNKFPNDFIKITDPWNAKDQKEYVKTITAMKNQIPIIYQAILHNPNNKTYGAVDLLIREDYINKLTDIPSLQTSTSSNTLSYYVIDIKWTTLFFHTNKQTLRNNTNVKPFKTQLLLYNEALEYTQNMKSDIGFILSKGWINEKFVGGKKIVTRSRSPFNKLGIVEFNGIDKDYKLVANDAIQWYQTLVKSTNWSHDPPSNNYLRPNMSNTSDYGYTKLKKQMAMKYNEITDIWQCGVSNRDNALSHGISSYLDPELTTQILGITGKKITPIVDRILKVNRDEKLIYLPKEITDNTGGWRKDKHRLIIDFECITSIFFEEEDSNPIDIAYLIGVMYNDNYTPLKLEGIKGVKDLIISFFDYIGKFANENNLKEVRLYHWTNYEQSVLNKMMSKYNLKISTFETKYKIKIIFVDFYSIFVYKLQMIIKGANNFRIKSIHKAMYEHKLVTSKWENNMTGEDASYFGWKYYNGDENREELEEKMNQIEVYNKQDCIALKDIINFCESLGKD